MLVEISNPNQDALIPLLLVSFFCLKLKYLLFDFFPTFGDPSGYQQRGF